MIYQCNTDQLSRCIFFLNGTTLIAIKWQKTLYILNRVDQIEKMPVDCLIDWH